MNKTLRTWTLFFSARAPKFRQSGSLPWTDPDLGEERRDDLGVGFQAQASFSSCSGSETK